MAILPMRKITSPLFWALMLFVLAACNKTSTRKTYWENGQLKSLLSYQSDSILNGPAVWYYENGRKQQEVNYLANKLEGKSLRWYESGKLQSEIWYSNSLKDSISVLYDKDGYKSAVEYYRNDTIEGPYSRYYPHGETMISGFYRKGMMDGSWLFYNVEGQIIGKADYQLGTGIQKAWYSNGNLSRVIRYVNNLREGAEEYFTPEGQLKKTLYYSAGVLVKEEITKKN